MPGVDFAGIEARLNWVSEALDALNEETRLWLMENNPHSFFHDFDPETDTHLLRLEPEVAPLKFAVSASNVVHQLRSSLDNLVWQLVIANEQKPSRGERGNKFPIWNPDSRNDDLRFGINKDGALRGVHPDHFAVIQGLQPYQHPDPLEVIPFHPLTVLSSLSNADKHQEMKVGVMRDDLDSRPVLEIGGEGIETASYEWIDPPPGEKLGAIVCRVKITPSGPHPNMHVTPEGVAGLYFVGLDIDLPAITVLRVLLAAVRNIGNAFFDYVPLGLPAAPMEIVGRVLAASFMRECGYPPSIAFDQEAWVKVGLVPEDWPGL